MSLATFFNWNAVPTDSEIPDIYPMGIAEKEFVEADIITIYSKILTDVLERCQGLTDDQQALLWDNCVKSESSDGLITLLSKAMSDKKELFLVYEKKPVNVIRLATGDEAEKIRADYKLRASSETGIYISFKNNTRADIIKVYSALDFCTVSSLNKSMNISKAVQIKMADLRKSVGLADSAEVKTQGKAVATSLRNGKDILIDAEDTIETAKPDLTAVDASFSTINQKRAFYLGMPASYISGEQTRGLGDTGEGDQKAVERGLKNYYMSVMKPVLFAIFGVNITYKTQDFRQITQALEAMKTFSLCDEEFLTSENKKKVIEALLDIDPDDNKDTTEPEDLKDVTPDPLKIVAPPDKKEVKASV